MRSESKSVAVALLDSLLVPPLRRCLWHCPTHIPGLMEGLLSSSMHLERERMAHPLLPTQQALSFGLLSFTGTLRPSTCGAERSRHQAYGCCRPAQLAPLPAWR